MPTQETAAQVQIKQAVLDNIRQRPGFILIEGDPGSGKTFIKTALINALRNQVLVVDLNYSRYSFEELITTIADRLKVRFQEGNIESALNALKQFCRRKAQSRTPLALIIDDAQYLPIATLESLKEAIIGNESDSLILHGILISDRTLKPSLELNFLTESLVHTTINIPRPSEAEMRSLIRQLITTEHRSFSISEDAEMEIMMGSEGSFRKAKTLLKQAAEICQQSGKTCIDEAMVVDAKSDEAGIPILDNEISDSSGAIPDALQGILSHSLLDTPEKPVLKQKRGDSNIPLFVNDLSNESVSPLESPTPKAPKESPQLFVDEPFKPKQTPKPAAKQEPQTRPSAQTQAAQQSVSANTATPSKPAPQATPTKPVETTATKTDTVANTRTASASSSIKTNQQDTKPPASQARPSSEAVVADAEANKAKTSKTDTTKTGTTITGTTKPADDLLTLKPEEFLEKQSKQSASSTQQKAQFDPETKKPKRTLSLVAGFIFIVLVAGLGWLSTQPGFNPEAKFGQIKSIVLDALNNVAPKLAAGFQSSNQNSSGLNSSDIKETPVETPISTPLTIESKPEPIAITTDTVALSENTSSEVDKSEADNPVSALESEKAAELEKLVGEVEARLEEETDDLSQITQNAIEELATTKIPKTAKTEQNQTTIVQTPAVTEQTSTALSTLAQAQAPEQPIPEQSIPEQSIEANDQQTEPAQEESAQSAIQEIEDLLDAEAREAQMAMLKKKAKIHIDNYRYTIPENDNAVLTLRRIKSLDSSNSWAEEQLNWIKDQYLRRAQSASRQGNRIVATQNYGRLLWIDPEDQTVKLAISKLSN